MPTSGDPVFPLSSKLESYVAEMLLMLINAPKQKRKFSNANCHLTSLICFKLNETFLMSIDAS
jgi:hypothetical protein